MDRVYHAQITRRALREHFDVSALSQIVAANRAQDDLANQLRGCLHFDNNIGKGLAYVESEHARISALTSEPNTGSRQRAALGRLCHAAQDFYAHSNYVRLWLAQNGGLDRTGPQDIDGLDEGLLCSPDLRVGTFYLWRDLWYYVPGLSRLVSALHVPAGSHQAMNLDSPERGPEFDYALAAACQRTQAEYRRAAAGILRFAGPKALDRFHTSALTACG